MNLIAVKSTQVVLHGAVRTKDEPSGLGVSTHGASFTRLTTDVLLRKAGLFLGLSALYSLRNTFRRSAT